MATFKYQKSERWLVRPHRPRNARRVVDPSGNVVWLDVRKQLREGWLEVEDLTEAELDAIVAERRAR